MKLKEAQLLGVLAMIAVGIILLCMWGSDEAPDGSMAIDDATDLVDGVGVPTDARARQLIDELQRPVETTVVRRQAPEPSTVRMGIGGTTAPAVATESARVNDAIYSHQPDEIPLTQPEPEAPAVRQSIRPKPRTIIHTVVKGDTLGEISTKYYGTSKKVKDIQRANGNIHPQRLSIGMELKIPPLPRTLSVASGASQAARPTLAASRTGSSKPRRTYTVKKGDSLYKIAQRFYGDGTRYKDILRANRELLRGSDLLRPEMEIVIP